MATQLNLSRIKEGVVRMDDGNEISFTKEDLQEWMGRNGSAGGGWDVERTADAVQGALGILEKMDINEFIDDEKKARASLLKANTALIEYWQKKDPDMVKILRHQMAAQERLDDAQTDISRSLDRAVLVASGAAGAKALFSSRYGNSSGGSSLLGNSSGNLALGALGGFAVFKLLDDDDDDSSGRRRKAIGVSTTPTV